MKKPVLTVRAVSRCNSPDSGDGVCLHRSVDVEEMLREDPKPLKKRQKVLTFQSNVQMAPRSHATSNSLYQVFVHNLPTGITTEELAQAFRKCGSVKKVEILDYSNPEEESKKKQPKIRQQVPESMM